MTPDLKTAAQHLDIAKGKIESALQCHPQAVRHLLGEPWDAINKAPVPAWQMNPDGTVETDTSKGTTAVHVWRAMIAASPSAAPIAAEPAGPHPGFDSDRCGGDCFADPEPAGVHEPAGSEDQAVYQSIAQNYHASLAEPAGVPPLPDDFGIAAFAEYLKDCDECAIVPDVAGAFNAGWKAGRQQGMEQAKAEIDAAQTAAYADGREAE